MVRVVYMIGLERHLEKDGEVDLLGIIGLIFLYGWHH
ncbi:hypothetical protein SDC9_129110 [bioreactor metagenome]|uniref:Uncharacterized protein n=1 Tax=bioreactor metagenome TaxID=1076179 RepID=A0A645CZR1_9ZZZZ